MRLPRPQRAQLGTGALVIVALALGQMLSEYLPDGKDSARLFETAVAMGESATIRAGEVSPTAVEGARTVLRESDPSIRAQGLGVVVRFDFVAHGEATGLSYGELRGGNGTTITISGFGQRSRLACPIVPPGLVQHCSAVMEVDPQALPGATFGVSVDSLDPRFDEMAVIDLGIDAADVERWQDTASIEVTASAVEGL